MKRKTTKEVIDKMPTLTTLEDAQKKANKMMRDRLDTMKIAPTKMLTIPSIPTSEPSALNTQIAGSHYKNFAIQPVEFITKNRLPFLEGCVIKRACRHRAKNGAEDIRKAIHELQLILELEYPNA